jgi:glycosyltransferase involved in cell wall biosynthesis
MRFQEYYQAALRFGWFDPCFYFDALQSTGISLQDSGLSLFEHYATVGWKRGLSPSERFSVEGYLDRYGDVRDSRMDPLYHYLVSGQSQQRTAFPLIHDHGRSGPAASFCLFFDCLDWVRRSAGDDDPLEALYRLAYAALEFLSDPRQLRVRSKPLLVVYRPELLEDPQLTFGLWREVARRAGLGGLFVAGLPLHLDSDCALGLDETIGAAAGPASPEALRAWLVAIAGQAPAHRSPPQLVFMDALDGWLKVAPEADQDTEPVSKLRRFALDIALSDRLPVLFLCDGDAGRVPSLIAALEQAGDIECFTLVDEEAQTGDSRRRPNTLGLSDLDGTGWSREQKVEVVAGLMRARGDLVVSGSLATSDLLAPFAAQGHGIVSLLHELAAPIEQAKLAAVAADIDEITRCAHRIVVSSQSVRKRLATACAVAGGDIQVIPPKELRNCLLGLGNEGRRVRLTGSTLGRQEIADDLCVVIPSYNHRQYILAAVDSILAQSVRPKEIRIIDDGSNDGSADLVRSLVCEGLGIVVEARQNRGAHATINQGIAETRCPIVAVMNSDDRWHPLRIEELIGDLRRPGGADVVFSRVRFMGPGRRSDHKRNWYERGVADFNNGTPLWLALMFRNFFFTTSNLMARREKFLEVGGLGPLRYCHDLDYMLKAIFAGHKVQFVDQTLCDYRVHASNSIDESVHKVLFEEAWIIVKHLQQNLRRISEVEKLIVAQRSCDKGLATRVLGILRAASHVDSPLNDDLVYAEQQFVKIMEHTHDEAIMMVEPVQLVCEMALLGLTRGAEAMPVTDRR